ncbi:MAG: EAL domain-containing protein [Gammaproteobacteria bacterium]|nr:EAL domain-containing protein [Gammaproteobacteria bacterium]
MIQGTPPSEQQLARLSQHLKRMEDLWQKLVYVRWSHESFSLLARLAQEMAQIAGEQDSGTQITELAKRLENLLDACVSSGNIPHETDRERLRVLFNQIHRLLHPSEHTSTLSVTSSLLSSQPDVFLVDEEQNTSLQTKLEDVGYKVHYFNNSHEIETALSQIAPAAVIVDMDSAKGSLEGIEMVAELRAREDFLTTPVLFVAERDDLEARLEAWRAGATGYFPKPIDMTEMLEFLRDTLAQQLEERHRRILIVNDNADEVKQLDKHLQIQGVSTRVVINPMQVIQEVHRFRPDLLLLDLDLKHVSGLELAGALAQHRECQRLPIILLSSAQDLASQLSRLRMENAWTDLLLKPLAPEFLHWLVQHRLRRSHAVNAKLSTLSDKDSITGLYNRRYLLTQLEHNLAALGISIRSLVVMFLMIENFRALRDATSMAVVDELVEQVSQRMRKIMGPRRWVARFNESIFALVLNDTPQEGLLELARKLRNTLEEKPYETGKYSLRVRVCIGISVASDPEQDVLGLIRSADAACSRAREEKTERIYLQKHLYANWDQSGDQAQQLQQDVQDALQQRRLKLVFQPIVSLYGDQAERYEVLLRMYNDDGNEIPIKAVFGAVQQHPAGQILDRWVITEAIRQLAERWARGIATTLFIKASFATLTDKGFEVWLQEALKTYRLGGDHLVFEIPESVAESNQRLARGFLTALKNLGCGLSLESFGRGVDPMGLLENLPADCVKLDNYFARNLVNDPEKQQQLQDLIVRLETLGTASVVSGIEDMRTLPVLWSLGVNYVQGYFLQQPHENMTYDFRGSTF